MSSRRSILAGIAALAASPARARGIGPIKIPLRSVYGLPSTTARVNDRGCGALLISTGHAWVTLDQTALDRLGATRGIRGPADTVLGEQETTFYGTRRFVLNDALQFSNYHLASLAPGFADPDFEGAVGGIFSRVGALFDFEDRNLTIGNPSDFYTRGFAILRSLGGPRQRAGRLDRNGANGPVETRVVEWNRNFDRRPIVSAELEGRRVRLLLDTGYPGSILLYGPAPDRGAPDGQVWLYGAGPVSKLGRAASLKLGSLGLSGPVVEYLGSSGPHSNTLRPIDGAIGMEILRRTSLFLDIGGETVKLKPNVAWDEPFAYNRTGLTVTKTGSQIVVANVTVGAPAWRAGLRPGDQISRWDGDPSLRALDMNLKGSAGTVIRLHAVRDGKAAIIPITLEELV